MESVLPLRRAGRRHALQSNEAAPVDLGQKPDGQLSLAFSLLLRLLEIFVAEDPLIGVGGVRALGEVQLVHVWRGPLAPAVGELLGVVFSRLCGSLLTCHDVVGQVEGKVVGLFVMATCRNLTSSAVDHDTSIEVRQIRTPLG